MISITRLPKLFKDKYIIFITVILFISAFFRLYRIGSLLGFWYDQGRDALVIWDLLHYGKFFLIGPVTGIDGIYLGPFYYYLLTPFYWAGGGNPVFPAIGFGLMGVGSVYLVYWLGKQVFNQWVGLISALFYGFSFDVVTGNRWLSNPNPLPFFTLLLWVFLWRFLKGKSFSLIVTSFIMGLCLQLEAASAIFFIPSLMLITLLYRKNIKNRFTLPLAIFAFGATLLPQLVFNFRHDGILVQAFKIFLVTDKSFGVSLLQTVGDRLKLYYDVIFNALFPGQHWLALLLLASFSASVIICRKKLFTVSTKSLWLWVIVPLFGYLFYRGNHGYFWGYYLTSIVPVAFILISAGLVFLTAHRVFTWPVLLIMVLFIVINTNKIRVYHQTGIGIILRAQLKAINWIYQDAKGESFNYDVYVPPNIYYAYSYLFKWYGISKYGRQPETKLVSRLYTLAEPDGEHPQFLQAWRQRQDGIGIIKDSYFWGDITVEKRERILYD